jgi:acetyl esterase/lipase
MSDTLGTIAVMRRSRMLIVVAALAVIGAGCDFPNILPPGAAPVRYRDAIFNTVAMTSDITYGSAVNLSGQTITLKLDVYAPPASDSVTSRPAIVWVHGGSFSGGDKTSPELVDESNTFAKKGFVNASIDYRLEPGGCSAGGVTAECITAIQEAEQDAQTAVRFLRTHAATYGIDPTRIAIGGSSAGAITALNVGYASSENPASKVRAAVSLSGANLLSNIGPGDAPALLFHGTSDPLVPYQWAVNTTNAAQAAHLQVYLETWPGAGHVPYVQFRTQILTQTQNFLWWEMDLQDAPH